MAAEWSCLCQNYQQSLVYHTTNDSLFCCHVTERQAALESDEYFQRSLYPCWPV